MFLHCQDYHVLHCQLYHHLCASPGKILEAMQHFCRYHTEKGKDDITGVAAYKAKFDQAKTLLQQGKVKGTEGKELLVFKYLASAEQLQQLDEMVAAINAKKSNDLAELKKLASTVEPKNGAAKARKVDNAALQAMDMFKLS